MIPVELKELNRKFNLYLGEKKVGEVLVYCTSGRAAGYKMERDGVTGLLEPRYVETRDTLRAATNAVLRALGYGNARGIDVRRSTGGRT